jgi:hypothetical protein
MSAHAGFELASTRLRQPGTLSAGLLALCFTVSVALLERAQGRGGAADRALLGGAFGIALPLLCYFLVARSCAGGSLQSAVNPLARHGLSRRALVLGLALPAALVASLFAALSGALVVLITRGTGDALWLRDAASCLWIGAISGVAYVLSFVGASGYGSRGQGRAWLLAADFVLGAGGSLLAVPWPKGHVRNLLGGTPVLGLSQLIALLLLLGTSFAFLGLGSLRTRR